jgi:hypothetical protein
MVEFALVFPLFLLLVMGTIDFGGYFSSRLSVEEAARAGDRVAAVQDVVSSYSASSIVSAITGQEGLAKVPTTNDCLWQGTTLDPNQSPPFNWSTGNGCIGIWYFDLGSANTGPPTLCTQWSVQHSAFGSWSSGTSPSWTAATPPNGCVSAAPGTNMVVVGVGYQYRPLTPTPSIVIGALATYGESQLLEEGNVAS